MPSINFTITAEDKNLQEVLKNIERGVSDTSRKVEASGASIDTMMSRLAKGAAALGVAFSAQELVRKVADVRGEFQQLEVAFNTMLGSAEKSSALMAQLTETAAITPFGLQEVAGSAKQLLAYGVAADEVNERLIMLGDIAAGLSIPLSDLAYLYGTTMTQGRMYTQDLNQFMGRGIPLADELAKQFGVTKDKVKDLVTSGKVGFEEMHKSLVAMTSSGGKFGGLMEAQSKTIKGQISNLEDAIDVMFNEIGKTQEGVINSGISLASKLVENYEAVGKVLMSLAATYGTYKAAVMATVAIQKIETAVVQQAAVQKALAAMAGHTLTASQARGAAIGQLYAAVQAKVAASLKAVTASALANPYALITAAVVGLVAGVITLSKKLDENTNSFNRTKKAGEDYLAFLKEWQKKAQDTVGVIQDETSTISDKIRAYEELKTLMPEITEQYTMEELAVLGAAKANEELAKQREEAEKKGREIDIDNRKKVLAEYEGRMASLKALGKAREKEYQMLATNPVYLQYKKETEALIALDKKVEEEAAKPKVKDKKYWEDLKKDLQMKFEALTPDMEGSEAWETLKKQIQEAESMIAKYNIDKTEKTDKDANELNAKKAEYKLALEQYKQEIIAEAKDAQMEIRQAEINAMKDGNDKVIAQIDLDYQKRLAENEKRKQEYINDIAEQKAQEWEIKNPKLAEKGQKFDKSTVTEANLTPEQKAILEYYDLLAKKEKELAEANATKELLSQYQTYMQKRKETYEKYERDLAAMKNEDGSYKEGFSKENEDILNKNRQDALDAIDVEFAMREEQFQVWANEISSKSLAELEKMLTQAEEKLEEMKDKAASGEISKDELMKYLAAVKVVKDAKKNLQISPDKQSKKDWKELYDTLGQISSQFKELGDTIGGTVGMVISAAGEIASSTLSMIDGIRALTDGSIEAIKGASEAATKALQSVERASIILAIVGSALKIMTKISELSKSSGYEKMKNEYEELISAWDELIERKLEYLNLSYGEEAKRVEEETLEVIQKQIDAYKELAKERMDSDRRKGSGTLGRRMMRENYLSSEAQQELKDAGYGDLIGINKGYDLLNLTGEQLKDLMNNATQFWLELDEEVRRYLEGIIEGYDKIADTEKKLQEQLTAISFDSMYDSFMNTLMDMESSSEDFAEDLSEMLTKALLSEVIGNKYKDKLKKWYESWAASMEGGLTDQELSNLRSEYQGIVQDAIRERDALAAFTGYGSEATSEQNATYGGFESMSEETGSELNGRFTALQMAGEEIKNQMISSVVALNALVTSSELSSGILGDILTQHAITNAYLEDIVKYSKVVSGYGAKLDKIVEQTKNL